MGIHRSPVNSHQKRPVTRSLGIFLAGDLIRHRAHYDVIVMPNMGMLYVNHKYIDDQNTYQHKGINTSLIQIASHPNK